MARRKRRGLATKPASLDGIEFDALLKDEEQYSSTIPDYPVESGYKVHDSVLPDPLTIKTTLYLSNTPVTWKSRLGTSRTRVQDVLEQLRDAFWNREPVTYVTSSKTWKNMCIKSLDIQHDPEYGYARKIDVELKQVEVTATKTGVVPASYARGGASSASAGTASTKSTTASKPTSGASNSTTTQKQESQSKASILYKAGKGLGLIK